MMKNYFKSIALMMLLFLGFQAQAAITYSFNSVSTLDSVKVENLTSNTSTVLKGNYSLVVGANVASGIQDLTASGNNSNNLLVYPNPFKNEVFLEYYAPKQGDVDISVYDISGKVVAQYKKSLEQGAHRLNFKPNCMGMYLVKVSDKTISSTSKLFCLQSDASTPRIEYEGAIETAKSKPNFSKASIENALSTVTANAGDMIRFTGYSGTRITSLYDVANASKSYTFTFGARYFNIKNFNIQASKPCLVDIMFSVTDANNKGVDYLSNTDFTVLEDNATASPTETFRFIRKMQQLPATIRTVLLLDNSASLSTDIETIKAAAIKFIQSISDKQEVAVYVFSDIPVMRQNFTTDKTLLQNAINGISLGFPSTNLYGSTITALSQWTDTYSLSGIIQGSLVLFTDGSDTQGSSTLSAVTASRGDKKIYVIGLGSEINATALNSIANPAPYYPVQKASELDAVFATIQSDIAQFANSFYWLNYMSPKRTSTHTLKISAISNTNTSTTSYLTGSFVANGFLPVSSGVYANIEDARIYGLDTIRCYSYYGIKRYHIYDNSNTTLLSNDSLVLKPTTYWVVKQPIYTWSINKPNTCKLLTGTISSAKLFPNSIQSDTAIVTLKDEANGYIKNIVLIICPELPTLTTAAPKNTTSTTASLGGEVINMGRTTVTTRGVCFSTTSNPNIGNSKVLSGSGKGTFEVLASGLAVGTTYFVRAYATNSIGTIYGNEVSFTTLPTVTTTAISAITATTATSGGTITPSGVAALAGIFRGVCWSTKPNPTVVDSKTTDGTGTGIFTSNITGLVNGTTYYLRAYVTNSTGTSYGAEVSFVAFYPIGTTYLGGKIAYLDNSGTHGFVCAVADQSTSIKWNNGSIIYTGASNFNFYPSLETIGVYGITKSGGRKNTDAIISAQGVGVYAASICSEMTTGDATAGEWYLPSPGELNQLYINRAILGGFSSDYYWSSYEDANYGYSFAYFQSFNDGSYQSSGKVKLYHVRAIRAF